VKNLTEEMAGGIGPPRDSTRRALVGTAEKESSSRLRKNQGISWRLA
jgi:hypothetical protein